MGYILSIGAWPARTFAFELSLAVRATVSAREWFVMTARHMRSGVANGRAGP